MYQTFVSLSKAHKNAQTTDFCYLRLIMIGIHTLVLVLVLLLATPAIIQALICPSTAATDTITIAGSTTVQPIAAAWGAAYGAQCGTMVNVQGGGSSSGAQRVCGVTTAGTAVDIGAMSRAWKSTEATVIVGGFKYQCVIGTPTKVVQIDVAIDGLVVILKKGSLPATCITALGGLTFAQLRWIFSSYTAAQLKSTGWPTSALANSDSNDKTHLYSEISASCPKTEMRLAGPSSVLDSYTYFLETILTDYVGPETFATTTRPAGAGYIGTTSDTATINTVKNDPTGATIGFVSFNAYNSVPTTVKAVSLKKSGGYVAPTLATIASGTYPLSRRIFMNVLASTVAKTKTFIEYGMSNLGTADVITSGFIAIPVASRATMNARL